MSSFNYQKICLDLLRNLSPRTEEVISQRFGLKTGKRKTLEAIGKNYGITRERVRQIEKDGFSKIKPRIKQHQEVFQYFNNQIKSFGGLKKENILLEKLSNKKDWPQVYFLLTLGNDFKKFRETKEFYPFWTFSQNSLTSIEETIDSFYQGLKKTKCPLTLNAIKPFGSLPENSLISYLEIFKKFQKNSENLFGLKEWPEINPHGVKDLAFLVLKKEKTPLHFNQITKLIRKALPQTVHNELIRDERFVLVGRGIYALKEWGYESGEVKDVIFKTLERAKKPLTREEILGQVLQQRLVKENTILLNLSNKKYFLRDLQGKYIIRKA